MIRACLHLKFESRDEYLGIRDWGLGVAGDWDFSGIVIPSAAEDLYCTAGISVYAPRENDVLGKR